jgi:hypothetical protein
MKDFNSAVESIISNIDKAMELSYGDPSSVTVGLVFKELPPFTNRDLMVEVQKRFPKYGIETIKDFVKYEEVYVLEWKVYT